VETIVPTVEFPLLTPFTDQATLVGKFPGEETVAVKACALPAGTDALAGATLTWRLSVRVTIADALLAGNDWLVAVTVTLGGFGKVAGAV
jgi:hypothetical protein